LVPESSPSLLSQLQKLFIRQAAQERPDIRENFLARRRVTLRETVDELAEGELAGAALEDVGRDCIGLEDPLRRKQDPAAAPRCERAEPPAAAVAAPRRE
jgi:hypothetical protein